MTQTAHTTTSPPSLPLQIAEAELELRVRAVRDIVVPRYIQDPTALATYTNALNNAEKYLRTHAPPMQIGAYWRIRGSPIRDDNNQVLQENGYTVYIWHMATMDTCTCADYYREKLGTNFTRSLACDHQLVAWLMSVRL